MKIAIKNANAAIIVLWQEYEQYATLTISHLSIRYGYYTEQRSEHEFLIMPEKPISCYMPSIKLIPEHDRYNFFNSYYKRDKEGEEFLFLRNHIPFNEQSERPLVDGPIRIH